AAGTFAGTINLGGANLVSQGGNDVWLAKLDPLGNHLWSKDIGGGSDQSVQGVAVDGGGNVVVVGTMDGSVDFGGGAQPTAGGNDVFVAKYDASGALLWAKRFGDANDQAPAGVALDSASDAFVVGATGGAVD